MEIRTDLLLGDCKNELKKITDNSVDLIITSPPYAPSVKALTAVFIRTSMLNGFFQYQNSF